MPVVWNTEAEAKLLAGLFKVCDIKVGFKQLEELAAIIGPDCTPKAVSHRIAKFKKMAGAFNGGKKGGDAAAEDSEDEAGDEASPATPKKTKKSGKGAKTSKKRAAQEDAGDGDYVGTGKKLKAEATEDDC